MLQVLFLKTLARMVRRQRMVPDGDFLTDDLRKSIRGEDLIIHESDNLLILSIPLNLQLLAFKDHWLCDSTFDSAPVGFQLYTVHVMLDESHTIPLVYCIARNKTQATYDLIFSTLKQVRPDLNPVSATSDYERAALNGITTCFPNTNIFGCFFHYGQCLWRQIQGLGLQTWYNDPRKALIVKSVQALAFVPVSDVTESFNEFVSALDDETDELLSEFLGYFEATWIGVVQRGRRRRPAFELRLWNILERNTQGLPRTTNSFEGWHRGFEQRMAITHPTVCRLVSKLRKEQSDWELTIEQTAAGMVLRKPKKKHQILNTRLKSVIEKYEEYPRIDFLRAIAHNL
ncbi:uncharacterized protein LOC121858377 [Homarus americanus]|uniref:uncharacterized protein LOC121858377 n=1 Tax=Homarus americanus TaxID=6706 RepID=UPI001C489FBF|nr:uncharacterized protein LOC121858377 [Homarus americanus]